MAKARGNLLATRDTLIASGAASPNDPTINGLDQAIAQGGNQPMQGALTPPPPMQQRPPLNLPMPQDPGFNVPMMAMAGAMLQPTRTGGFAESLGNALGVGAAETQKQREMLENEALRLQQQDDTRAYREGMLANTANRNDSYAQIAAARLAKAQADSALETAKAAMVGASKPTEADLIREARDSLVGSEDADGNLAVGPDGKPWTLLTATQAARSSQAALQNADTNATRTDNVAKWRADLAARATTKAAQDRIKGMTDEQIRLMVAAQNAGTPITPDAAGDTVTKLRANAGAAPPPAAGGPAAPAAPTNPTFPPAPAAAIEILKRDPSTWPYFVKRWGPDQALKALGQ